MQPFGMELVGRARNHFLVQSSSLAMLTLPWQWRLKVNLVTHLLFMERKISPGCSQKDGMGTDGSWSTGPNVTTDRDKSLALTLTSKPTTNDIMMLVQDNGDKLYAWRWDGDTETFSSKTHLNDPTVTEAFDGNLQFVYLWSTGS